MFCVALSHKPYNIVHTVQRQEDYPSRTGLVPEDCSTLLDNVGADDIHANLHDAVSRR